MTDFVREQVRAGAPPDDILESTEEYLRAQQIALPGVTVLNKLVIAAIIKAEEELHNCWESASRLIIKNASLGYW